MEKYKSIYKAREEILDIVKKDIIGPVDTEEILVENPTQYYISGKLYPLTEGKENDDLEDVTTNNAAEMNTDIYDVTLASSNLRTPGSMGITFTLKAGIKNFNVNLNYATYKNCTLDNLAEEKGKIEKYEKDIDEKTIFWKRTEYNKNFSFSVGKNESYVVAGDFYINSYTHKVFGTGESVITVVAANKHRIKEYDYIEINRHTIFQPEIMVTSGENKGKVFTYIRHQIDLEKAPENAELDMLYSNSKCYGQGHGCAVEWDTEDEDVRYVKSSFLPRYNLLQMKAAQIEGTPIFNMRYLYTADGKEVITHLYDFIENYEKWIKNLESRIEEKEYKEFHEAAIENVSKCKNVSSRIKKSISMLEKSEAVNGNEWKAFRYANEAMYMQRKQSLLKSNKIPVDENINWYPFQFAFMLLEIGSFIEPEGDERKLVDLLWFPTGGGKTEAYLGIAAFVIFYRRLSYIEQADGVTVIMRYTLRLLTIQQFERASILICACDLLRIKYNIPGMEISIGLWVGNKLTPGTLEAADLALMKLMNGADLGNDEADPCQVKVCPWCGEKLYTKDYSVDRVRKKMLIRCRNKQCEFNREDGIPIHLVDETIYEYRPTFIVATVDKFAQITLQDKPATLFAVDKKNLPPELIIQDELHLISGPLGTMTGIYEAAITKICERNNIPIKIIASTATIRNAGKQIKALYGRRFTQFPPQGVSAEDSFFAVRSNEMERPARLYVGCMGVGATFTTTLIRVYASWLFASRYLIDKGYDDVTIDNFWTLTGYFNSIRELGGAQTQIVDDIQSRYQYLKNKKFADLIPKFTGKDKYEYEVELTSRMTNDEISDVIQTKLKIPYKKDHTEDVYDFVLATNMISVGVDVGRLGTMVVAGQPKTNAEYIQATSRVGRDNPGLVFMVYNPSRSRDKSHYEQFLRYHSALYRYVEATSLTPFSDRARDRGLQALFVTLCRYLCPDLLNNENAANFNPDSEGVKRVEGIICKYVQEVDPLELNNVIRELKDIENKWAIEANGELYYKGKNKKSLLKPDIEEDDRFRCMNSMRSVEKQSGIYLMGETV